MGRRLFCQCGPVCYAISTAKERGLRWVRDLAGGEDFACCQEAESLPHMVMAHRSTLLRRLEGVDMSLQENKVTNLALAARGLDGLLLEPGQTLSFWRRVGEPSAGRGFLPGLTISGGKPGSDVGGGLCQMANLLHWLTLHSPLPVTELHHHTDALFPDSGRRVPFGTGTSVFYNNVDYRVKNETPDTYQYRVWLEAEDLCGELRCSRRLPTRLRIRERDHHYRREADGLWYRCSEIWRVEQDRVTGETLREELVFKNHSRVLFDPALIPPEQVREEVRR